ncbi:MAG: Lrp/AsnC family transcriptional regulator [Burkholderiales bacterium]
MGAIESFQPDCQRSTIRFSLVNDWQRDFPLVPRPFDAIAAACLQPPKRVLEEFSDLLEDGTISRIGGVFGLNAGGAGLLCAMTVPPDRLPQVAARINAEPGVNHNYEREHAFNLWFVATAPSREAAQALVHRIEVATGTEVVSLPMRRAYRIDLGFDLRAGTGIDRNGIQKAAVGAVPATLRPLAARLELGLPVDPRPFQCIGADVGLSENNVIDVLQHWTQDGILRRFGVIVRHHELGWASNAMTVFSLPDAQIDAAGARLAKQAGVHLCYRRETAANWPHNLYCMVHGRSRDEVIDLVNRATERSDLSAAPREVLFTGRRFKQTGSRYFAEAS